MAHKLATRSSTIDLEKEIREFAEETGLSLSAIYRRAHMLYMANHDRKKSKRVDI